MFGRSYFRNEENNKHINECAKVCGRSDGWQLRKKELLWIIIKTKIMNKHEQLKSTQMAILCVRAHNFIFWYKTTGTSRMSWISIQYPFSPTKINLICLCLYNSEHCQNLGMECFNWMVCVSPNNSIRQCKKKRQTVYDLIWFDMIAISPYYYNIFESSLISRHQNRDRSIKMVRSQAFHLWLCVMNRKMTASKHKLKHNRHRPIWKWVSEI